MKPKRRSLLIASTVLALLVLLATLFFHQDKPLYKVTVLPSLGTTYTRPTAINDQVPHKLGKLVYVTDINNHGCILGFILPGDSARVTDATDVLLEPIPERWEK